MGRKKKTAKEPSTRDTSCSVTRKMQTRSVQDMDDSTYMYMLIIGQLMYDRRHLIAEKLAVDLSVTAMALASSDALIRIIGKSREVQQNLSASIGQTSNVKQHISVKNQDSVKNEDTASTSFEDDVEDVEMLVPTNIDIDDNDESEINDESHSTTETKPKTQDKNLPKNIFPANLSDASNIPRETADGKIIMVYVPQEKFPCPRPNCKQTFLTKENLDYHLVCSRIHNPQFVKDWGCRYCGKEFSGMSHVKHHEKMKHEEHDKEVCYECGKQFDSLEKMKRHIDVHHLQKKYKCKEESCQMEFSSESGAKYHYKRVHLNDQIPCSIEGCPRKFDRNCDLKRHLEKAHRNGQLGSVTVRVPRKQLQQQPHFVHNQPKEHQQQPVQLQIQQHQQQILHVVEQTNEQQQQPLMASEYHQDEATYTTMQTMTQQMTIPATVVPTTALDPQQLNQEQLQAIQSLQFLQQQQQQQQQPQQPSQFQSVPASNYHGGYMY